MIKVYGIRERLDPIKEELSRVIHGVMQEVLGMPEDKRAQRFFPMDVADFYAPGGRSPAYTVIEINMIAGRKVETKKALLKTLFAAAEKELGLAPVDLEVTILEQPAHCWGFRGITGDEAKLSYAIEV